MDSENKRSAESIQEYPIRGPGDESQFQPAPMKRPSPPPSATKDLASTPPKVPMGPPASEASPDSEKADSEERPVAPPPPPAQVIAPTVVARPLLTAPSAILLLAGVSLLVFFVMFGKPTLMASKGNAVEDPPVVVVQKPIAPEPAKRDEVLADLENEIGAFRSQLDDRVRRESALEEKLATLQAELARRVAAEEQAVAPAPSTPAIADDSPFFLEVYVGEVVGRITSVNQYDANRCVVEFNHAPRIDSLGVMAVFRRPALPVGHPVSGANSLAGFLLVVRSNGRTVLGETSAAFDANLRAVGRPGGYRPRVGDFVVADAAN
jgi:hypothetical protein